MCLDFGVGLSCIQCSDISNEFLSHTGSCLMKDDFMPPQIH